jgi:hypothetical protein
MGMSLSQRVVRMTPLLDADERLIELPDDRPIVYIGDTHGDVDATKRVFSRFSPPAYVLVFLGDAVDRGPDSEANLDLIVAAKVAHPEAVHLLMGNHEAWSIAPFAPADFWHRLPAAAADAIATVLARLPYAAWHPSAVLAVHGALPDIGARSEIARLPTGSPAWRAITWGDWIPPEGSHVPLPGRPVFDQDAFEARARKLGVRVLVRSHQPSAPTFLYDDRCLTLFTSSAYGDGGRRVAVQRPGQTINSARDLELIDI